MICQTTNFTEKGQTENEHITSAKDPVSKQADLICTANQVDSEGSEISLMPMSF